MSSPSWMPSREPFKQLLAICEVLEIQKEYIHPRQSWENLVETHFNVMRRMSQVHFDQVTSWQGAKIADVRFVTDYNAQPHWAHRKRDDNRLSPAEVLGVTPQRNASLFMLVSPSLGTLSWRRACKQL